MSTVPPNPESPQFERDVALIFEALQVLRTLHGVAVTDDQLAERARNAVAALRGEFVLVNVGPATFAQVLGHLDAASALIVQLEGSAA